MCTRFQRHRIKSSVQSSHTMTRRNSPQAITNLDDLSSLDQMVVDKRLGQRSSAKKNRRNRHYEKQFIRNALALRNNGSDPSSPLAPSEE